MEQKNLPQIVCFVFLIPTVVAWVILGGNTLTATKREYAREMYEEEIDGALTARAALKGAKALEKSQEIQTPLEEIFDMIPAYCQLQKSYKAQHKAYARNFDDLEKPLFIQGVRLLYTETRVQDYGAKLEGAPEKAQIHIKEHYERNGTKGEFLLDCSNLKKLLCKSDEDEWCDETTAKWNHKIIIESPKE